MTRLLAESTKSEKTPTLPKISPISSMLRQANRLLLLSDCAKPRAACPPQCPPCYWWDGSGCEWDCDTGEFCCDGTCCSTGTTCCQGSCCHPDDCETCQGSKCKSTCNLETQHCCGGTCIAWEKWCCDGTPCDRPCCTDTDTDYCCPQGKPCCDGSCCDPCDCEECVDGSCVDICDPDECEVCQDGSCVDRCPLYEFCLECDGSGNCLSKCNSDLCQVCINDECIVCGVLNQSHCCLDGECVEKCDPYGGNVCTWTNPPVLDPLCTYLHEGSKQCLNPGDSCSWEVVEGPMFNDICAPCAPGCPLNSTYCVKLEPIVCKDVLSPWPPFNDCACTGTPELVTYRYPGTRYICP